MNSYMHAHAHADTHIHIPRESFGLANILKVPVHKAKKWRFLRITNTMNVRQKMGRKQIHHTLGIIPLTRRFRETSIQIKKL